MWYFIYAIIASIIGWNFMSNKIQYLEIKKPLNQVLKLVTSIIVGQFIAVFYVVYLVIVKLPKWLS